MKKRFTRPIILLEILIAFALIVLCALPLIYPHVAILKSERSFVSSVELNHLVNLLYANRLEKLYRNEIPWAEIEGSKEIPIDGSLLQQIGYKDELPFIGKYRFVEIKHKPSEPVDKIIYLYSLIFSFSPIKAKGESTPAATYTYYIMIERRMK